MTTLRIRLLILPFVLILTSCASTPPLSLDTTLFRDETFLPRQEVAVDIFALSPAMRDYLQGPVKKAILSEGKVQGLLDSLYSDSKLLLEYDSTLTRTAAEAFDARSGNCLSLAIMTSALARQLGIHVMYQEVLSEALWTQDREYIIVAGHVNLTLGRRPIETKVVGTNSAELVVDFLPRQQLRGQRARLIGEERIMAMYYTNRAAEQLVKGDVKGAYWYAKTAAERDPGYAAPFNTVGVVYRRLGLIAPAEAALRHALKLEPDNTRALANLVALLEGSGRMDDAAPLVAELKRLQPEPPFHHYQLAKAALLRGEYSLARDEFNAEQQRNGQNPEIHLGLAAAYIGLGQMEQARKQLALAVEKSTTPQDHRRYAGKLDRLRSMRVQ